MRAWLALLLLVAFASAPLLAQVGPGRDAPNFKFSKSWNLMQGYNDLESLHGRPLLVEHWATWCPPCVKNVPHMNQLHDMYSSVGLTIVAVSDERASTIEGFISQHGIRYPVVQSAEAGRLYGVQTIPSAFLVDARGRVVWSGHPAALSSEDIERYFGLKPLPVPGSTPGALATGATPEEGSGKLWLLAIGALALVLVGALGWFWWKTSDRPHRPAQTAFVQMPPGVAPPGAQPPGPPQPTPSGPTAVIATSQRPASSTSVAPLLGQQPGGPSSGATRSIKLTPSGRYPTIPYAANPNSEAEALLPVDTALPPPAPYPYPQAQPYPQQPQGYPPQYAPPQPYPQQLQPEPPPPAPPGKPVQFRPFNAGGRQQ